MLECARDLATGDKSQALYALEISMLDRKDALICEKGFGIVVDELPIDEAVDAMGRDCVNLRLHLLLCMA